MNHSAGSSTLFGAVYEATDVTLRIAAIAFLLLAQDFLERQFCFAATNHLVVPPLSAFFRRSGQENLANGLGKDNRSLVPSLGDDSSVFSDLPLQLDKVLAYSRILGGVVNLRGDLRRANLAAYVFIVQAFWLGQN